ncbi:pectate lyase [Pedobacter immunditicola]|uniref:pectate lyase n=1 Tax=Pedobacter immunditicola TaxID=3133440 RepID=UPI0030A016A9
MKLKIIWWFILLGLGTRIQAQQASRSVQMAATVLDIWKDSMNLNPAVPKAVKWAYDQGVILEGIDGLWRKTGDGKYFAYMQKSMDFFVTKDGQINRYLQADYNIDHIKNGKTLLKLYKVTGQPKYFKAATLLWEQLKQHPRTKEGGFWHKKIYPYQMWLDGLYMGQPFYAEYAALIRDNAAYDDIAKQFIFMEQHARDEKTGLLYHGWDESRKQKWADPIKGTSPHFWGRAMGWYGMALVDVLDYFPATHPKRSELINILKRLSVSVRKYQDPKTGLWWDIVDQGGRKGNYLEASASSMFVYTLTKGVRKGYLDNDNVAAALKGYRGIEKQFLEESPDKTKVDLHGTVSVSGLGGKPYRDGSYEYYISEKVITNDPKGVGAFLLAANEVERINMPKPGSGKLVLLDSYFNHELKKDALGNSVSWHYKWDEQSNNGFSLWGSQFANAGFNINTLYQAPTAANLKDAAVYIIVDPDTQKESERPNYMSKDHIQAISEWVNAGGILVLMANDTGNVELEQFNKLAAVFNIHFNGDSKGRVVNSQFDMGKVSIPENHMLFKTAKQLYIKEYSTLQIQKPARSLLKDKENDVMMAESSLGKGTVFAIGDPWLYNEYVDGRKLPAAFDNFKAGQDLVSWIAQRSPFGRDVIAERMLIYQRSIGGWPKAVNKLPLDYGQELSPAQELAIRADSLAKDATIDNKATTKEISYLMGAYQRTKNPRYLSAVKRGLDYIFMAQYDNGGWPQYYPLHNLYRAEITYNDHAMVNVMNVLQDVVERINGYEALDIAYKLKAQQAVAKGIDCVLKTQIRVNNKLTVWCAQYNERTLQPANARAFELVSLSGMESVGIVEFLMRIPDPAIEIKNSIRGAMDWFDKSKIQGYDFVFIDNPALPLGKDKVLKKVPNATIWARFYDIKTNKPFFTGRDGIKRNAVSQIDVERRTGYAWYGTWPEKLFTKKYPQWLKRIGA